MNADDLLTSLTKNIDTLGQGGAKLLLSKAQDVINNKSAAAAAALNPAGATATNTKAAGASLVTPSHAVEAVAAVGLLGLAWWTFIRRGRA